MRMLDRLRGERAIQATPWGQWGDEDTGPTWSGTNVTTRTSLQLLTVYGCNRFICEGISTLPVDVFRRLPDGSRVETTKPRWLERPTADLDRIAWLTQVLTSLLLDGNAYLRLVYDENINLRELVPLDPSQVAVRRNDRTKAKQYLVGGAEVDPFEILHIPAVMFPGADVGLSPIEAARQTIGKGLSVTEFAARFFGQGATMAGVIEWPGDLTDEQAKTMATSFARRHSGKARAHLPAVVPGGGQWKAAGVTNEQAQFLQTQQFTSAEIASFLFQIDPTEFGVSTDKGSSITYANLEQRNARKVTVTYLPWLVRIEAALSALVAAPRYVKFNVSGLLRGDTTTRWGTYQMASTINTAAAAAGQPPVLTTEEMRGFEDLQPLPPADTPTPAVSPTGSAP